MVRFRVVEDTPWQSVVLRCDNRSNKQGEEVGCAHQDEVGGRRNRIKFTIFDFRSLGTIALKPSVFLQNLTSKAVDLSGA